MSYLYSSAYLELGYTISRETSRGGEETLSATSGKTTNTNRCDTSTTNHEVLLNEHVVDINPSSTSTDSDCSVVVGHNDLVHCREIDGDTIATDVGSAAPRSVTTTTDSKLNVLGNEDVDCSNHLESTGRRHSACWHKRGLGISS